MTDVIRLLLQQPLGGGVETSAGCNKVCLVTIIQALLLPEAMIILAGSFIVAWYTGARRRYLLVLSASFLAMAAGFGTMIFHAWGHDRIVLPIANGFFIACQILLAEAFVQRRGKTFGLALNLTAFVFVFLLYYAFFVFGTILSRTLVLNAALFVIMAAAVMRFWIRRDDSIHDKLIFFTLLALGVMHCVRTLAIFFTESVIDSSSMVWQFMQMYILMFAMILALEVLASHFVESLDHLNSLRDLDGLTGVLNRAGFDRSVEAFYASGRAQSVTLILLDLDDFKTTNDTLGHPVGDAVLEAFGRILIAQSRETDIVGRLGGDEFAVFAAGLDGPGAQLFAERVRRVFSEIGGDGLAQGVETSCSVGVASLRSERGYEALYHMADEALYEAKRAGRNCVVVRNSFSGGGSTRLTA